MAEVQFHTQIVLEEFFDPETSETAYTAPVRTAATDAHTTPGLSSVKEPVVS